MPGCQGPRTGLRAAHGQRRTRLVVRWRHRTLEGWARSQRSGSSVPGGDIRGSRTTELVEEGVLRSLHSRSITSVVAGGLLPLAYRPSTSFAHQRKTGALGVGCTRVLALRCALALGRLAGFRTSSSQETSRGFYPSRWQHRRGSGRSVRSCRSPCGERHAPLVKLCT